MGSWQTRKMKSFKDLIVYKKVFSLAMKIYHITKNFSKDKLYSLTNKIIKSSHFISKISDADMENSETQVWIDFASSCNYIYKNVKQDLENESIEIGRLLNHMIENPEKYQSKSSPDI